MKYVYLENNTVVDRVRVDPFTVFNAAYAEKFIEAPDEVDHFWKLENGQWIAPVVPEPDYVEQNKFQASLLLQQTDWTATIDISNPEYSNPYLTNQQEFLNYRSLLRQIAVNPPSEPITDWPTKPDEIWSQS